MSEVELRAHTKHLEYCFLLTAYDRPLTTDADTLEYLWMSDLFDSLDDL